jgi:hypothetical protein
LPATRTQIAQAKELFSAFRGDAPEQLTKVRLAAPKTGLVIGELDGVLYTTVRDGKQEKYIHNFRKKSRPLLIASSDGKSLHVIGGKYAFTDAGIEDT